MKTLARLLAIAVAVAALTVAAGSAGAARLPGGIESITIHSAGVATLRVTSPEVVAKIVAWFDRLPPFVARPCPTPAEAPPEVTFDFRGLQASLILRTTDQAAGLCAGEIDSDGGAPLADHGFARRVSNLLGVDLTPSAQTIANEAAAKDNVQTLLGLVQVPAESEPLQRLSKTWTSVRWNAFAGAHRAWNVRLPLQSVFVFVKHHAPSGSTEDGSGWGKRGKVITDRELSYSLPPVAGQTYSGEVSFSLIAMGASKTRIAIDVGVAWIIVRSPNETMPAGVSAIVVHDPARNGRITDPDQVARVVQWFDSLPEARPLPGVNFGCFELAFRQAPRRVTIDFLGSDKTTLAKARLLTGLSDGFCNPIDLTFEHVPEEPLVGGHVLRRIERLSH